MNISKSHARHSPENSLSQYYNEVHGFPILTAQRERTLAMQWREREDHAAVQMLVNSHLRLVINIARGYRGYELPFEEVISEGNLGLLQAAKRFDPGVGCRLSTYATWWIRAAIHEYIMRSWSLVKVGTTAAQKKLFFNLRKLKNQMNIIDEGQLNPEQVSDISIRLKVPEVDVVNMNCRMSSSDFSLNAFVADGSNEQWQERLKDEREDQETVFAKKEGTALRRKLLISAMKKLSKREQRILIERRLKKRPITLEELSKKHNISRERVRQIECQAIKKVMKSTKSAMAEKAVAA